MGAVDTETDEKSSNLPEQKRAESVKQRIKTYQLQKTAIKEALCNLDKKPNHKIIFDEDSETQNGSDNNVESEHGEKRKSLFQSDDEDEENFNFDVKDQFDGERGQQLFELQTKFKGDKRFAFDARFTENKNENEIEDAEDSLEKEKQSEIEILEQVLGTKIKSNKQKIPDKVSTEKKMLRFDPTQSEHLKYQMTTEKKANKASKKKTKLDKTIDEIQPEPLVSKDVFYKVTNDLKTSLQTEGEFSLRNLLSRDDNEETNTLTEEEPIPLKHGNKLLGERNPFRYDSSDDEPEQENEQSVEKHTESQNNVKCVSEPLFFKDDDYRFQEGTDFVKRIASETNTAFVEQRRNLKNIIKAKVRHNHRRNNPFKKKLGGNKKKKLNRIKKALNR